MCPRDAELHGFFVVSPAMGQRNDTGHQLLGHLYLARDVADAARDATLIAIAERMRSCIVRMKMDVLVAPSTA